MIVKEALEVLKHHNAWRKGEDIEQLNPIKITQAIDGAILALSNKVDECDYCDCDLECDENFSYGEYENICYNCFEGLTG